MRGLPFPSERKWCFSVSIETAELVHGDDWSSICRYRGERDCMDGATDRFPRLNLRRFGRPLLGHPVAAPIAHPR